MNALISKRHPVVMGRTAFEDIFGSFFDDPFPVIKKSTNGYPLTDMFKDENGNQVIQMALAGFSKDDIAIETKDNSITISAKCDTCDTSENPICDQRRIAKRSFSKTFVDYKNKLDLSATKATFVDGLLSVTLFQLPENKPQLIEII